MRRGWPFLVVALAAGTFATAVAWTGGFDLRTAGMHLRSHDWHRPGLAAAVAFIVFISIERGPLTRRLHAAWPLLNSAAALRVVVSLAIAWTLLAGLRFGSDVAGGSDSSGYLSQARQLAAGHLSEPTPLKAAFTWPDVESTLTPLGYVRAPQPGRIVATYPPGLPLLMAAVFPFGVRAAYLLVPLFGALLVYFTWRAGYLLGDSLAGAMAALLLSLSPTFLLQVIQPMSDVPAAACWAAAIVCASREAKKGALIAGIFTGLAVMIRPNLAPLSVIGLALIAARRDDRARRLGLFLVPVAAMTGLLLAIQAVRYGSPFVSGYSNAGNLFSIASIGDNLRRYPRWITSTHTPLIWLCVAAPFAWRSARTQPLFVALTALIAGTWSAYLPYAAFQPDEWFYTRFLLPAIPFMLLLSCGVMIAAIRRAPQAVRPVLTVVLTLLLGAALARASTPIVAGTALSEQRYEEAGTFVRDSLPPDAVVLAAQHSGSVRFYSNRIIVRWDRASPADLDAIIAAIRAAGSSPFLVVDAPEMPDFRQRFAGQRAVGGLRPIAEFGGTRVYSVE